MHSHTQLRVTKATSTELLPASSAITHQPIIGFLGSVSKDVMRTKASHSPCGQHHAQVYLFKVGPPYPWAWLEGLKDLMDMTRSGGGRARPPKGEFQRHPSGF